MNFTYGDKTKKDIIKCCHLDLDNKEIIVNFLDGSTYKVPFVEEDYKNILNKMLEQAIERRDSNHYETVENSRSNGMVFTFAFLLTLAFGNMLNDSIMNKVVIISGSVVAAAALSSAIAALVNNNELNELKKYDLYLEIKDKIEEYKDNPNLFNGVNGKGYVLDISNIDYFSLRDVKKIKTNLEHCEQINGVVRKRK